MRIINLLDRASRDVEPQLLEMASSEDRVKAFKAQKLLELVRHLKAQGPAPEACGHVRNNELWLSPYNVANKVLVRVWVDWFDYAPLKEGLPEAHYRLQVQRRERVVSQDVRAASTTEAEEAIWQAFGWSS